MLNSAPRFSAASLRISATALMSSTGKRRAAFRYAVLITPQPMIPIPTFLIHVLRSYRCGPTQLLPLDRARGEARDDVLLGKNEQDDGREDRQRDEGENHRPFGRILPLIDHDAERPGIEVVGVQHHQRQKIGVPTVDEGDGAYGGQNRS